MVKTLGLLCAAGLLTGNVTAQNLLENNSFENGIKEWNTLNWKLGGGKSWLVPEWDKTVSQGHGGMHSMRMDYTDKKTCHLVYYKKITLPVDIKEITLSFWTKSAGYPNTTKGQLFLQLHFPKIKKRLQVSTPWNKIQEKWTFFTKDFQVPENCGEAQVILGIHGYKNPNGTTWVDNVYFGPKKAPEKAETVKKEITMLRGVPRAEHNGIWYPGEKMQYDLEVKEIKSPGSKATLKWRIEGFDRELLRSGEQVLTLPSNPVPPKKKSKYYKPPVIKIPFIVPDLGNYRGWFAIKAEIIQNGRSLDNVLSSGVIVEKIQGKRDPFFNAKNAGSLERQIRMGNGSFYLQFERRLLQDRVDGLCEKEVVKREKQIKEYKAHGFRPIVCFVNSQIINRKYPRQPIHIREKIDSALDKGLDPYDKEYYDGYEQYYHMLMKRFGKDIDDWTVGDEIYHTYHNSKLELPHYLETTKRLYKAVKAHNPKDLLFGAGCFMDMSPIGKTVWNELKNYLDGLSCSLYIQPGVVAEGMPLTGLEDGNLKARFAYTRSIIGNKAAIVGTESGYSFLNHPPIDSDMVKNVAINNARNIVMLRYLGVKYWTYFTFHNDGMYESAKYGYGKTDYGMWNLKTGCPKPHAAAWAVSARMMAFVTDPVEIQPNSDVFCYLFRKDGKTLAAVWAKSIDPINTEINMPADWKQTDFMGKTQSGKKGLQKLKINNRVLYFELDAPQKAVADAFKNGRYIMPEIYMALNRKNATEMNVFIKNKLNKELQAALQFNGKKKEIKLPAATVKAIPIPCKMEGKTISVSATVNGVRYDTAKEDEIYPVYRLNKAPAMNGTLKGFESVKPFLMNKRDFIQPAGDAESHGFWKGLKDLSAEIYLAYDKNYFYIAANVTDDINITRASNVNIWNQDCIQFGFDLDNDAFDRELSKPGYTEHDWEFCAGNTPVGPQLYCYTAKGRTINLLNKEKPVISRTKDGRTVYEIRIPWSELGNFKPQSGKVIGFNLVIFDLDSPKGQLNNWMEISRGIAGGGKDPIQFKRFILK